MKRNTYWHNILIIKTIGRDKTYFIGKNINIALLIILSIFLLPSCEHASEAELRKAANSANNDSTLWRSLQGFWHVEAPKICSWRHFFRLKAPNFIEIHDNKNGLIHFKSTKKNAVFCDFRIKMSLKQTCRTESSYLVKPLFLTVRVLLYERQWRIFSISASPRCASSLRFNRCLRECPWGNHPRKNAEPLQ